MATITYNIDTMVGTSLNEKAILNIPINKTNKSYNSCQNYRIIDDKILDKTIKNFKDKPINEYYSAEIASLVAFYIEKQNENPFSTIKIVAELITTDTIASVLCAKYIKCAMDKLNACSTLDITNEIHKALKNIKINFVENYYENSNGNRKNSIIQHLNLDDNEFETKGLVDLFKKLTPNIQPSYRPNTYINITGGYKGIIPLLTFFAQLRLIPLFYKYESIKAIVHVPAMPMMIDEDLIKELLWFYLGLDGNSTFTKTISSEFIVINKVYNIYNVHTNKLTIYGHILMDFIKKHDKNSKELLSFMVEYKVWEWYLNNIYTDSDNINYNADSKSISIKVNGIKDTNKQVGEIDILLKSCCSKSILIEVKALASRKNVFELSEFIEFEESNHNNKNRIAHYEQVTNTIIKEMHIVLYHYFDLVPEIIQEIKKITVPNHFKKPLKIFTLNIGISPNDELNIFQHFYQRKIGEKLYKEKHPMELKPILYRDTKGNWTEL